MNCKINEKRVFSNQKVIDKLEELGVQLVKVDMTGNEQVYKRDLARAERSNIPVNLIYPADYPARPAILLEELFGPGQALQALEKIEPNASGSASASASSKGSKNRSLADKR